MLESLEKTGLSKGEAKVYLALFELKEGTKYSIAKIAKVSASKVYEILDKLIDKGLVSSVIKNNVMRFYPANPQKLQEYIQTKKTELEQQEEIVEKLIPQLINKAAQKEESSKVAVYEGIEGIKSIAAELKRDFTAEKEWMAMGIRSSKKEIFNRLWIDFHKLRAKCKSKCRFIFTDKGTDYYYKLKSIPLTKIKVIQQITPSGVAIYGEKVMIFYYGERPSAVLIINKDIAESFKEFFNGMWKLAKD